MNLRTISVSEAIFPERLCGFFRLKGQGPVVSCSMLTFVRNIVGAVLVIGLSFAIGCSSTQSNSKKTNVFPWHKATQKKTEERAVATSMEEFIGRPRVNR